MKLSVSVSTRTVCDAMKVLATAHTAAVPRAAPIPTVLAFRSHVRAAAATIASRHRTCCDSIGLTEGARLPLADTPPPLRGLSRLIVGHAYPQATNWHTRRPALAALNA